MNCPVCESDIILQCCKCEFRDSICENEHQWHYQDGIPVIKPYHTIGVMTPAGMIHKRLSLCPGDTRPSPLGRCDQGLCDADIISSYVLPFGTRCTQCARGHTEFVNV
jgi:hypothetical protein